MLYAIMKCISVPFSLGIKVTISSINVWSCLIQLQQVESIFLLSAYNIQSTSFGGTPLAVLKFQIQFLSIFSSTFYPFPRYFSEPHPSYESTPFITVIRETKHECTYKKYILIKYDLPETFLTSFHYSYHHKKIRLPLHSIAIAYIYIM